MTKIHREDNTFVVTKNGMPYHVVEGMPEYAELRDEYAANPENFTEEYPPEPYVPTAQELAQEEIERLEALQTPRLMREALAGGEYAINKLAEIDALIAVQRAIINPPVAESVEAGQPTDTMRAEQVDAPESKQESSQTAEE